VDRSGHYAPSIDGFTFQQVQKYEKGANRIGASRLQQLSHILHVPVAFFFEGAPNASAPHGSHGSALSVDQIDDFVSNSDGLRLIGAFMRIDNAALRRRIVMLVQEIAGDDQLGCLARSAREGVLVLANAPSARHRAALSQSYKSRTNLTRCSCCYLESPNSKPRA
jgi:transcriptional regulator with XRE-family HTH domain